MSAPAIEAQVTIDELRSAVECFRAALEAYANAGHWYVVDLHDGCGRRWIWRNGEGPDTARAALKQ